METYEDLNQQLGNLCDRCHKLDFNRVFRTEPIQELGIQVLRFSSKLLERKRKRSECGLCKVFYESRPSYNENSAFHVRLFNTVQGSRLDSSGSSLPLEPFLSVINSQPNGKYDYRAIEEIRYGGVFGYICDDNLESGSIRRVCERTIDYQLMKDQLSACTANHASCNAIQSGPVNLTYLNLIDCLEGKIVRGSLSDQYTTLSYVWGKQKETAAESSLSDFCLERCPLTVRDAVQAVLNLGRRFLWVDRYCIDEKDSTERREMIYNMDRIYEHSECTIVALHGDCDESGLPGVSTTLRSPQPKVQTEKGILISSCPPITTLIQQSKWATRCWTYQEARLSRRCLFFSKFQVYLVCRQGVKSESVPLDHSTSIVTHLLNDTRLDAFLHGRDFTNPDGFHSDRAEYTKRDLTKPVDILAAFWGISQRSLFTSIGGIPVTLMGSDLDPNVGFAIGCLWRRKAENTRPMAVFKAKQPFFGRRRPGFPTWSWTSLKAEVCQDKFHRHSPYGKFTSGIPSEFPRNGANITFAPLIDQNFTSLTHETLRSISASKLQAVKEIFVDGEFISLRGRHLGRWDEEYRIGDRWIRFVSDLWDPDSESSMPGQPANTDEEFKRDALVLIQWNDFSPPSMVRFLLMLVEWIGDNRAERRGILSTYNLEYPRAVIESLPRERRTFVLQ